MRLNLSLVLNFGNEIHDMVLGCNLFYWRLNWTKTDIGWWLHLGPCWIDYTNYGKITLSMQSNPDEDYLKPITKGD
jgi:hypothetical protein